MSISMLISQIQIYVSYIYNSDFCIVCYYWPRLALLYLREKKHTLFFLLLNEQCSVQQYPWGSAV